MSKNRVKLRWPEHVSKPFEPHTASRRRTLHPSPEAAEVLALVEARFERFAHIPRKDRDPAAIENQARLESRLRYAGRRTDSLTWVDGVTTKSSAWDADNGAGVKRQRPMVSEPVGYTARTKADAPPPAIGLSPEAVDNLHAQRAWKR